MCVCVCGKIVYAYRMCTWVWKYFYPCVFVFRRIGVFSVCIRISWLLCGGVWSYVQMLHGTWYGVCVMACDVVAWEVFCVSVRMCVHLSVWWIVKSCVVSGYVGVWNGNCGWGNRKKEGEKRKGKEWVLKVECSGGGDEKGRRWGGVGYTVGKVVS